MQNDEAFASVKYKCDIINTVIPDLDVLQLFIRAERSPLT